MASVFGSTALGQESTASGDLSTALGQLSTASAYASTALGQFSTAAFANSTAVGSGVATTRDNQMSLGTSSNTYTAAGINSAASTAAQSGPVRFVTADNGGNLATTDANSIVTGSSAFQNLQSDVGQNSNDIRNLQSDSRQNTEGVAMAIALGGSAGILPDDKTFAASSNIGTFQGQSALGFGAVGRLNDNWFLNAGVGTGISHGTVGGRAGVTYAW
ncbi:MAG: YadA-like family protein [Planctomycetales bacterium]|nr:YadA-like family protein [Planctomycetales bacterium]